MSGGRNVKTGQVRGLALNSAAAHLIVWIGKHVMNE